MLLLPGSHEGVVAVGVLSTDALDDGQLLGLLGVALEHLRLGVLDVPHVGHPGEGAQSSLALRLVCVLRGLGATLLAGGAAALLAHDGGQALIQAQLLSEGQGLKQGNNLVSGGHLKRVKRSTTGCGGD